nr:hypothetical protein [Rhizoctonia sp.]
MKSHSRSILYVVDKNEKDISLNDMKDKCNYVLLKISNFNNVKIIFRYTTNNGKQVPLVSVENINDIQNNKYIISDYIISRVNLGLLHNLNEIKTFSLTYSYEKPIFKKQRG